MLLIVYLYGFSQWGLNPSYPSLINIHVAHYIWCPSKELPFFTVFFLFINSANCVLKNAQFLAFLDDIKICYGIDFFNDCLVLQNDLSKMVRWADKLRLQFNTTKCHFMTVTHFKSLIMFNYG